MSTERLSFGFNSLIPETYKNKAEAFAKCLQHKLLSLGGIDTAKDSYPGEAKKRLNSDSYLVRGGNENFISIPKSGYSEKWGRQNGSPGEEWEETSTENMRETSRKCEKTDSDEDFCSYSESESGDLPERRNLIDRKSEQALRKLISMSSEDSTVESWCSCQDNLTDFEKLDSETEEVNFFASQIKGSPKLQNLNMRAKRKGIREKPWKKNSKRNYRETADTDAVYGRTQNQMETLDADSLPQYILLDGLDLEDDEVPYRILRESSSTSNLEKHFSNMPPERGIWNGKIKTKPKEGSSSGIETNLLTPPPSPDMKTRNLCIRRNESPNFFTGQDEKTKEDLWKSLNFAVIGTDSEGIIFDEVQMKDFTLSNLPVNVKKVGDVIIECPKDDEDDLKTDSECLEDLERIPKVFQVVVNTVEIFQDKAVSVEDRKSEYLLEEPEENNKPEMKPQSEPEAEEDVKPKVESKNQNSEGNELMNSRSKLRRCSSLKTWKTPPGTPGAKKIVRFADALGLDLADVRTFLDEIPKVPNSAYQDLHFELPFSVESPPPPPSILIPLFQQPGTKIDFLEKVQQQKICLEQAFVRNTSVLTVIGYVRVQNVSFEKSVHVRYSLNNWETFSDVQANYVPNSCDGFSDKFSFTLYGHTLKIGQKLEFALRFDSSGNQYWDNNGGINYVFDCLPQSSANGYFSPLQIDYWLDFC